MNQERRRSRRNRSTPTRQRMVDPDAWTPDNESSPHPAVEELPTLPVPTPSSSTTSYNADDALQPLITQPADPVAAAIARRQNTVVTVTSTQFGGTINPNSSQQDDGIPIGTIAASASVGVFLAVSIVGCWWWFCKRPYTKRHYKPSARPSHKNQTSTSSVAPLNGSPPKTPGPVSSRRSREKQPGLNPSAPPSHARSTSGGPPGGKQQQRRPGQPAVPPPAVLPPTASPPSTTTTPPKSKRRTPPGSNTSPSGRSPSLSDSASLTPPSPASTLVEQPSTPSGKGGVVGSKPTSYTPQKPSPLALGAERAKPKEKPKEKTKVNEWGMGFPVSAGNTSAPSSPTSSGHGHESTTERGVPPPPVPRVPSSGANAAAAANAGRRSANLLAIPEPAAHFHSRRDRISVLSDSSYYALDDDEDGPQDVYMGVALGGDEPSPIPEEYFSPKYGEEDDDDRRGSRMQRHQEDYFSSSRQQGTYGGYGYQQQYQQQQQPPSSQYRSQGGYGYGGNQQSYGR